MEPVKLTSPEGVEFRDLNKNGRMDPFEDPRLSIEERVDDLLSRLSLAEKAGLMFQTVIEAGTDGAVLEHPGAISKSPTSVVVLEKHLSHFNVHALDDPRMAARWHNALQALAEQTPHGIPVTVSTDPRHAFMENAGVSFSARAFSQWPEPLGKPRPTRGAMWSTTSSSTQPGSPDRTTPSALRRPHGHEPSSTPSRSSVPAST
jgi:beta-glucosidase